MDTQFLTTEAFPFAVAIALMFMFGLFELVGMGLSAIELDFDLDHDGLPDAGQYLGWLGIGKVPLSVVMIVLLATFGLAGLVIQSLLHLPVFIAVGLALAASLPTTGTIAGLLARVWPKDETTIINLDFLLGKRAKLLGNAKVGYPAEAKVFDIYGQPHYIMVEPHGDYEMPTGLEVLLSSRNGRVFKAIDPSGGLRAIEAKENIE